MALGPQDAAASAWNRPTGEGLVVFDYTLGAGTDYFDGRGHLAPARAYTKGELAGYVEYGATDWLMLVARPSLDNVRIGAPDAGQYKGLGTTSAGAQVHLLQVGPAVLAAQATGSLPGTTSRKNSAEIGNTAHEADFRRLGGIGGIPLWHFEGFIDTQASYRLRSGGAAAEWHSDLTFGIKLTPKVMFLLQSVTVVPTGSGTAWLPSSRSTELGLTSVYALTPRLSIDLGVFTTLTGRNALRERGVTTGVWYRF
jgi:protein XagA